MVNIFQPLIVYGLFALLIKSEEPPSLKALCLRLKSFTDEGDL